MINPLSLLSWQWKAGIIAAVVAGAVYWHSHAVTVAEERGYAKGQEKLLIDQERALKAKYASAEQAIAAREAEISDQSGRLAEERVRLDSAGRAVNSSLAQSLSIIRTQAQENRNVVAALPVSDLVPAIVDELAVIRAARTARAIQ